MTGIDTNVLVRYIVQDDQSQAKSATNYIEKKLSKDNFGFVNHIVICELVWILEKCYKTSKQKIIQIIEQILHTAQFKVHNSQIVWLSLNDFRKGSADFSDYLIGRINLSKECASTITFYKKAAKCKNFQLLKG